MEALFVQLAPIFGLALIAIIILVSVWPAKKPEGGNRAQLNAERKRFDTIENVSNRCENAFMDLLAEPAFLKRVTARPRFKVINDVWGCGRVVGVFDRSGAPLVRIFVGTGAELSVDIELQFGTAAMRTSYGVVSIDTLLAECAQFIRAHYGPVDKRA